MTESTALVYRRQPEAISLITFELPTHLRIGIKND